jgi:isopenicillin N synthase-like dioxygenase
MVVPNPAPAATTELGDMALHHYTDAGALTILLQDQVGGLQVEARDEWIDVATLPAVGGERPKYRTVNWGAFRQARTDGDYADFGKEIQIADFRIP